MITAAASGRFSVGNGGLIPRLVGSAGGFGSFRYLPAPSPSHLQRYRNASHQQHISYERMRLPSVVASTEAKQVPDFYRFEQSLFSRTDLSPTAKMVFLAIRDRIGNNGKCWPGIRRIAADCGLTPPTVMAAIKVLTDETIGLLEVTRVEGNPGGKTNIYKLAEACKELARSKSRTCKNDEVARAKNGTINVQDLCTEPDQANQTNEPDQDHPPTPQGVTHSAPSEANPDLFGEVSAEPPDHPDPKPAAFVWPDDVWSLIASSIRRPGMDTPELREAWADWCGYWREEVRKPFGRRVAINQLRALEEHTPADAVAMIRHSIGSGYKRLVFPTNNGDGRNGQRGSAQVVRSDGTGYAEFLAAMAQRGTR